MKYTSTGRKDVGDHDGHFASERVQRQIKSAVSGNRDDALGVMREFFNATNGCRIPDRIVLDYISKCFGSILEGEKPDSAFNICKPRGRPKLSKDELIDIAVDVELEIRHNIQKTGKPRKTEAKETVATRLCKEANFYLKDRNFHNQYRFESVRKAYEKNSALAGEIVDKLLSKI